MLNTLILISMYCFSCYRACKRQQQNEFSARFCKTRTGIEQVLIAVPGLFISGANERLIIYSLERLLDFYVAFLFPASLNVDGIHCILSI